MKEYIKKFKYGGHDYTMSLTDNYTKLHFEGRIYEIPSLPCQVRVPIQDKIALVMCNKNSITVEIDGKAVGNGDLPQLYLIEGAALIGMIFGSGYLVNVLVALAAALLGLLLASRSFFTRLSSAAKWAVSAIISAAALSPLINYLV